jgi:tetratricopeptide (TPR) repeat protein
VQALVKAGNAYFNMKNFAEAQKNYLMAVSVYEKYRTTSDIDVGDVAEAYFSIGEIFYDAFLKIRLDARNERDMKALTAEKTKALGEPAKYYAKAIEIGVEQWTIRGTYMIGRGFVDMAEAVANQKLFGTVDEQLGSKVKILSALEKYYQKAQEYFYKNIEWAHTQNISGAYIDSSVDRFMEMMYRKGFIMEEVGVTLKNAPVPKSLDPEEKEAYRQLLEEKWLEAQDKALPKYLEAIKAAQELGIAQSQWLDKTKERIREIKPDAEELNANIVAWVPAARPVAPAQGGTDNLVAGSTGRPVRTGTYDAETEREMRRIQNVLSMTIPADDKIRQLSRIEMDANRNIEIEKTRIKELKQQLQR